MLRSCPASIGPINAPMENAIDKIENVRPYLLPPLSSMRSEESAGKITPFAMPSNKSMVKNGNGAPVAMAK